jgi:hypothetical protein
VTAWVDDGRLQQHTAADGINSVMGTIPCGQSLCTSTDILVTVRGSVVKSSCVQWVNTLIG